MGFCDELNIIMTHQNICFYVLIMIQSWFASGKFIKLYLNTINI